MIETIRFKRDTNFRKMLFTEDSFAHPAKMDSQFLLYLVERYTKAGDVILDPMFGSGTCMLACTVGRHVIGIELESKFVRMSLENRERISQRCQLGYKQGDSLVLWGDARDMARARLHPYRELWFKFRKLDIAGVKAVRRKFRLPLGDMPTWGSGILVDHCLFSPPYAENTHPTDDPKELEYLRPGRAARVAGTAGNSEGQIGRLHYGDIQAVITSPTYGNSPGTPSLGSVNKDDWGHEGTDIVKRRGLVKGYSSNPDNLGNLKYGEIDSVITSPPYSEGGGHGGKPNRCALEHRQSSMEQGTEDLYSTREDNIGNLKSASYLEAMRLVYAECFKVLKPGGLLILVLKNFIRHRKIVRLDLDTQALCESVGFVFQERLQRELPAQSFWRILYKKKYGITIDYEDCLIFQKKVSE